MASASEFNVDGDLSLTVPLRENFAKILYDFVQLTASKSGFEGKDSERIASQIRRMVLEKIRGAGRKKAHVRVSLAHSHGHITIRTIIEELSFRQEDRFKVKES
jgi:hypothetical protein